MTNTCYGCKHYSMEPVTVGTMKVRDCMHPNHNRREMYDSNFWRDITRDYCPHHAPASPTPEAP